MTKKAVKKTPEFKSLLEVTTAKESKILLAQVEDFLVKIMNQPCAELTRQEALKIVPHLVKDFGSVTIKDCNFTANAEECLKLK